MSNAKKAHTIMKRNSQFFGIGSYFAERCAKWNQRAFLREKEAPFSFTYSELWKEIQCAITAFRSFEIGRGDRVLLCMENSAASIAMFMGALVEGIVPVLVSPKKKIAELKHVAEICGVVAFLSSLENGERIRNELDIPFLSIDAFRSLPPAEVSVLGEAISPGDTAYIVFTSGSTGTQKRVEVSHHNMLSEIRSMGEAYGLTQNDRHLCILPIYHASGLYRNVLLTFHTGGYVILAKEFREETFWQEIAFEQITFVQVVPAILTMLLTHQQYFKSGLEKSLRFIGSASAPHPTEMLRAFEKAFGVYVLQGYGMTETTCGITLNPLKVEERKLGSVGKPLSVNTVEVWGDNGATLPPGTVGDIMVSGDNITGIFENTCAFGHSRYHRRKKWLATGDMGYVDDEGFVWLNSRRSDLIKRAGYRISPNQVENIICASFRNLEAAVIGVPHRLFGQDIIAFVSGEKAKSLSSRGIIREIKGKMASYEVPSEILFVDYIPMLGVGKVDKEELLQHYYRCKGKVDEGNVNR